MKILAIDTSTDFLSVAVWNDETIFEITTLAPKKHSELLDKFIEMALQYSNFVVQDIDCIALAIGPGSYTGLRIGVAFVQGFCAVTEAKIIAVDSLLAQAGRYAPSNISVAAISDARSGHIYGGIFDVRENPTPIIESARLKIEDFAVKLSSRGQVILCGSYAEKFYAQWNNLVHGTELIIPQDCRRTSASVVAKIASRKAGRNEFISPENLEPKYLFEFKPGVRKRKPII